MAHILIVDDEQRIRALLRMMLVAAGHEVCEADDGRSALQVLDDVAVDIVISDMRMEAMGGLELLAAIRERELGCPLIFITAYATLESAVDALRLGAADYLVKPFEEEAVILAVERALGVRRVLTENLSLKQRIAASTNRSGGVFASPAMGRVAELAAKVADREVTVLLTGESGTGKEVVAQHIHRQGSRHDQPFVAVNCAAIAPTLIEAELFGHERGAFTGADKTRAGKFEFAAGGTLFLDEIGELPLEAQAKLLRAIQEKNIQRVGGNREIPVTCRLVCATNRDLPALVRQGNFREDLYYRLAVFPIELPPLRERREDIEPLVRHCLARLGGSCSETEVLTPAALRLLQTYAWPGNVRELFNAVERAMILKGGDGPFCTDDFTHLGGRCGREIQVAEECFELPPAGIDFDALQRNIVAQALELTQGNQSAAARLLGVSRARFRTLHGLLDEAPPPQQRRITIQVRRGGQPPE